MGATFRSEDGDRREVGGVVTFAPQAHQQVKDFLQRSHPSPDPWTVDVETLRREARHLVLGVRGELPAVAAVETVEVGGVHGRLYRARGAEQDVLIWAHGGGWIHGDLDGCEGVARALANRAGCAVLTVDYRLAPEHPFPAGFDDVWTVVDWARTAFAGVAVGGDSSGGNLAAAVALKARDSGLDLAAQLLVYPVLDSTEDTDFKRAFIERYASFAGQRGYGANTRKRLKFIWATYLRDPSLRETPFASPMHAATLSGVAPVILITAEHDFLRGEAETYAQRLQEAHVPVQIHNYAGQIHGFFEMLGVMDDAHHAVGAAGDGLRRAFAEHGSRT